YCLLFFFFFQAEDGIRDFHVTGVQTCALPIYRARTPDAVWLFADRFLAVDHFQNRTYLLALSERHGTGAAAERWLDRTATLLGRSEERRVGEGCRPRWWRHQ